MEKANLPEVTDTGEFHCLFVRSDFLRKIGFLDERLITREQNDFALRTRHAGGRVGFEPKAIVTYNAKTKQFPVAVANRLLEDSQDAKMGGWVKQDTTAMFVVKIDADATPDQLSDAIDAAIRTADAMELELTKKDEF